MKKLYFFIGILVLLAAEFFKIYYIMPFPGSQQGTALDISYFFHSYIWFFRIGGLLLLLPFLIKQFPKIRWWAKVLFLLPLILYGWFYYMCNFDFIANKMFSVIGKKQMASVQHNRINNSKLVIGISLNGESRAYPIEIIGYHHQIMDTIGGTPIIATYCTVCRTGRIYKSSIEGKNETFRLVGMDQFNAMFEDASTGSWWQQATGICVKGPQKGKKMNELYSQQMSLGEWVKQNPETRILQNDNAFDSFYAELDEYDEGTMKSSLEGRDNASWKPKSWILGIVLANTSIAVDWNDLQKLKCIQTKDFVALMLNDNVNYFVYSNRLDNNLLEFNYNAETQQLIDVKTNSVFNYNGVCVEGSLKDKRLKPIPAYQEFWHSWQTFHPASEQYKI
jgi:Protein of unknown function (DUF3179)